MIWMIFIKQKKKNSFDVQFKAVGQERLDIFEIFTHMQNIWAETNCEK